MANACNIGANQARCYQVTLKDLPLSCPTANMRLWDSHPKVYLPIETTGEAVCGYCGAKFILVNSLDDGNKNHVNIKS